MRWTALLALRLLVVAVVVLALLPAVVVGLAHRFLDWSEDVERRLM